MEIQKCEDEGQEREQAIESQSEEFERFVEQVNSCISICHSVN